MIETRVTGSVCAWGWLTALAMVVCGCAREEPKPERVAEHDAALSDSSLVAHWSFDDCDPSTTTLADSSGNGLDATKYEGVACAAGHDGLAVQFDGVDDVVRRADGPLLELSDALTITAWVNPSEIQGLRTIVNQWYAMDSFNLLVESGYYQFEIAFPCPQDGWGCHYRISAPATADEWTHVAAVFDGATMTMQLYLDGALAASRDIELPEGATPTLMPSGQPICIGNCPGWNAFEGRIDEVRLYRRALGKCELEQLYTPTPAPAGHWTFDECDPAIALDSSGNGHHGEKIYGSGGGLSCVPGKVGGALLFDGSDDLVRAADHPDLDFEDALTASAWVKPSEVQGLRTIVNKWYALDAFNLLLESGSYQFEIAFPCPQDGWGCHYRITAPATVNVWTHVAGVFDGASMTMKLYLDGVLAASQVIVLPEGATPTLQQSGQPVCIGNCPGWNAFAGVIDDVRLTGKALTPEQIVAIMTPCDLCDGVSCDDDDVCTADSCNPSTGACLHEAESCDDGDACTIDACDPAIGCVYGGETSVFFDAATATPHCCDIGSACIADASFIAPRLGEPNAPNTLGSACADGTKKSADEAITAITLEPAPGGALSPGATVIATVDYECGGKKTWIDLWYSPSATEPSWSNAGAIQCTGKGPGTASFLLTLGPAPGDHVVRAQARNIHGKSYLASSCSGDDNDDHDDVVFRVAEPN